MISLFYAKTQQTKKHQKQSQAYQTHATQAQQTARRKGSNQSEAKGDCAESERAKKD